MLCIFAKHIAASMWPSWMFIGHTKDQVGASQLICLRLHSLDCLAYWHLASEHSKLKLEFPLPMLGEVSDLKPDLWHGCLKRKLVEACDCSWRGGSALGKQECMKVGYVGCTGHYRYEDTLNLFAQQVAANMWPSWMFIGHSKDIQRSSGSSSATCSETKAWSLNGWIFSMNLQPPETFRDQAQSGPAALGVGQQYRA